MATLTIQELSSDGLQATYDPADVAGDDFDNALAAGKNAPFIHVKNGDASPIDVTPAIVQTVDGQSVVPKVHSIPAGGEKFIGPFDRTAYGSTVNLTYSSVTSVTIAVLQ